MNSRFTRWATGTAVALSLFAGAGMAQAASLTSTQVSAILSLLQSFGADQSIINNVSASLGGSASTNSSCLNLSNNLTLGSSGSDVTSLQNYLISKGNLTGTSATGYYGYLTASAVGQLQISLGIVSSQSDSAYGIMGPRTRAAVGCGGATTVSPAQPVAPTQPVQPTSSTTPTATIDQSSLISTSGYPIVAGTASGIPVTADGGQPQVTVTIAFQGTLEKVFTVPVVNGRWSVTTSTGTSLDNPLANGTYNIYVFNAADPNLNNPITMGALTVAAISGSPTTNASQVSSTPTATINPVSVSNGATTLTGVVSNSTNGLWIELVSNYNGSVTSIGTLSALTQSGYVPVASRVTTTNGQWSASFSSLSGTETALVYDAATGKLLVSQAFSVPAY